MSRSRSSLLKDGSWIRKLDDEDESVDRDPNFGRSVLSHLTTGDGLSSPQTEEVTSTKSITTSTSVQALSKRFTGSQDDLSSSTTTTTTTVTKDGKTTETTVTTSGDLRVEDTLIPASVMASYSPMDGKSSYSSTETVTVRSGTNGDYRTTTTTRSSSSTAEDDLYDKLLPRAITSSLNSPIRLESPTLSSPSSTRRTTSYSSYSDDIPSLRTTSYTVSTKSSDPYDVDSRSSTYTIGTKSSDPYDVDSRSSTYSYSRPDSSYEYTSITGPSSYSSTTYRSSSSRSDDGLSDSLYSKSSTKSLYSSSDRAVLEKDLCTYCHKPFDGDAKMVLEEMKINCHATCFKCEVCKSTLAHLKAGDSMWVYKHMVHCENCFETTRERWKR
ncbi:sciellin isoform X3 [Xyrichtys novacula]|uniref:Sciellin isoform X3 n=1 Tax=Xyrichtys novacula TaxID=13765 RepID=A0AAV1H668_XYRNO|nr:sciellin isoform X3 [Xyrichtys novacula]